MYYLTLPFLLTVDTQQLSGGIIAAIVVVPTILYYIYATMCIAGCLTMCAVAKRHHDNASNRPTSTFPLQQTGMAGNRQTQPRQDPQTIGITPLAMGTGGGTKSMSLLDLIPIYHLTSP